MTVSLLSRLSFQNPVLLKDLRTRMRGAKAFIIEGAYMAILVLMIGIAYFVWWSAHRSGASPLLISANVGRLFYMLIFETQAALVVLITPALTAGSITLEREQQTYDLLACTRLSPRTILVGKLLSGWLFVVMLLTCSLPMASLCLMFGGVSTGEIAASYLMLCLFALLFGSVGILCSSLFARSVSAVVTAYLLIFGYLIGTMVVDPMQLQVARVLNPFAFLAMSADPVSLFTRSLPPWLPAAVILSLAMLLAMNWAMTRLPHFVVNRALAIRALTALLLASGVVLGLGLPRTRFSAVSPLVITIAGAAGLVVVALFFATGELPARGPRYLIGWLATGVDPRRMFSNELRGGWSYLVLLAVVFAATLRMSALLPQPPVATLPWMPAPGSPGGPPPAPSLTGMSYTAAVRLFVLLAAVLVCYSALGAIGAALRSRRSGVVLMMAFFAITHFLPGILWIRHIAVSQSGPAGVNRSLYLAPYVGVLTIADPQAAKQAIPAGMRWPAARPVWEVSVVIYLVAAGAFLLAAELIHQLNSRLAGASEQASGPAAESGG